MTIVVRAPLDAIGHGARVHAMAQKEAHRSAGRRRSVEDEQEERSKKQIKDAWDPPWVVERIPKDLGEDLLVRIYNEGKSTGLSFYVQLKSTSNLEAFALRREPDCVSYSVATKDLLHWEDSMPPVVLVIWDVATNSGVWLDVPAALKALDQKGKTWRRKKSTSVKMPREHRTDQSGRNVLRSTIASLALPMLSRGKQMRINPTFSFPNTPEGHAQLDALRKTIDEGGTVTVRREHIKQFRMSGWWERAHGAQVPEFVTISSSPSPLSMPLQLQVVGPDRTESLSLELKRTRAGMKQMTFETDGKASAVNLTLVVHEPANGQAQVQVSIGFNHPCETVHESLALTKVLIAMKQGGTLQLVLPGGAVVGQPKFDFSGGRDLDELVRWEEVLQKLSYIEARVARFGRFSVRELADRDVPVIKRLHTILTTGEFKTRMKFAMTLKGPPKKPLPMDGAHSGPIAIQINPFGEEKLLGVRIPFGEVEVEFLEPGAFLRRMREASESSLPEPKIELKDAPVVQRYHDWTPPKTGPERVPEVTSKRKTQHPSRGRRAPSRRRKARP